MGAALVTSTDSGASRLVYLLAHRRSGPYLIGVGRDLDDVGQQVREIQLARAKSGEQQIRDHYWLVWYEREATYAKACARMAQLRRWPLSWQRRLIESMNPDWLEQSQLALGVAPELWNRVHETTGNT